MAHEREYYEQKELWKKDLLSISAEKERVFVTIELIPPDVQTVLDVGCGNGAFLNALENKYQAIGLDFSREALKYVKTKVVQGDIGSLPFRSKSFDLVTCLEVLEHLPHKVFKKALRELQRVSRKYIIVTVPNNENLDYHLVICPECRCWYNPHRHVRSFDSTKVRALFDHFELLELKEIGPLEPRPRYSRFLYTAYRLWRNSIPPSTAICPQCGYQTPMKGSSIYTVRPSGLSTFAISVLKLFANIIWRPRWCHRWILALYVRKELFQGNL